MCCWDPGRSRQGSQESPLHVGWMCGSGPGFVFACLKGHVCSSVHVLRGVGRVPRGFLCSQAPGWGDSGVHVTAFVPAHRPH